MNDALDRLRNRQRPTVPSRDATLQSSSPDISTSRYPEQQTSESPDEPEALQLDPRGVESSSDSALKPNQEPEVEKPTSQATPLATKQSTLRLESGLSDRLQQRCRDNAICREVLIEAMFEYCEANPSILEAVLGVARQKNEHRQEVANRRRARAMMNRFGA